MKISVIIPAFNEQAHIGRTLDALAAQTLFGSEFEVIVVDNGSSDQTVSVAKSYEGRLRLRVVVKRGGSIASVRNYGAALAVGEVLAFLDGDCIAKRTWLEEGLALTAEDRLWGAHYLVPEDATWVGRVWFDYQAKEQEGPATFIPGSNLFLLRRQFVALKGFSEATETSEDVDLSQRARQAGMQTLAFPRLAVSHEGTPRRLQQFYRQNRWHGMTVLRLFLAHLPALDHWQVVAVSVYVLLAFWSSLLLSPLLSLRGHLLWALVPIGLLLLPALSLTCLKTLKARRPQDAPALFTLYMTYFLARAAALVRRPKRTHRPAAVPALDN